jgi:hypothetical protein
MGAFLLAKKPAGIEADGLGKLISSSLQVFDKKGMSLNKRVVVKDYVLYTFHKSKLKVDNTAVFDDGQFIAATGTLIYKRKTGREALVNLFHDFSPKQDYLADTLGQYGLVVFKNGELYISNDYTGYYHIYTNSQKNMISNSFLAILKSLPQRTISPQELYEYVVGGSCFGGKTLIKEIELIDHKGVFQILPEMRALPKPPAAPPYIRRFEDVSSLEKTAQQLAEEMIDYFSILKANFGDSVCSPLTGGVHTRLMLGCMKRVGIKPAYMYILGDPNNKIGRDANAFPIAKSIADAEGLDVDFMDTTIVHKIDLEKYREFIERSYYLGDGLAHEVGLFQSSFYPELRWSRAEKAQLVLNGAGGETFRNYWVLPDRPYNIDAFIKARYDSMDSSVFSKHFDRQSYFSIYREKMKKSLDIDSDLLSRKQVELVQPDFENRYWMGNNNSVNCQLSHYLTPWADAQINYQACDVPIKFKDFSLFECALMRAIDPSLAKFPTAQGVDLMYNRMKLSRRVNNLARQYIPIWLKSYLRTHFYNAAREYLSWRGNKLQLPYNLSDEYLEKIFPAKDLNISQYFRIDTINNPTVLSRALTAELVINNRF